MCFAHPRRSDQHQIARFLEPWVSHELHLLVPGNLGIELPVEVTDGLHPLDAGAGQQVADLFCLAQSGFLFQEPLTAVVVAKTGHMARMNAVVPGEFVERKRATERATGQAEIVEVIEGLVREYLVGLVGFRSLH